MSSPIRRTALAALSLVATACDPVIDVEGTFFPAWLVCIVMGVALSLLTHRLFVAARVHAHLGPPLLIYSCLGLLFTLASWLVLYRT